MFEIQECRVALLEDLLSAILNNLTLVTNRYRIQNVVRNAQPTIHGVAEVPAQLHVRVIPGLSIVVSPFVWLALEDLPLDAIL